MKIFLFITVIAMTVAAVAAPAPAAKKGAKTQAAALTAAATQYKSKCAACHGADGKGDTAAGKKLGVKDFHDPEVAKESDADLIKVTKEGKGKMPKFDGKLTDDQIKALIAYIRKLK